MASPVLVSASPPRSASAPAGEQDVLRLDVAVDDALRVRPLERAGQLLGDSQRVVHRQVHLAREARAERLALDARHGEPRERRPIRAGEHPRVEERHDVRVLEPRREPHLAEESLRAERAGEIGVQNFERHPPVVTEVAGQPDGGHAAASELALDRVAVAEGRAEKCQHRVALTSTTLQRVTRRSGE
jgi:hypothetical protein